jgi:hypothetical protein
MELPLTPEYREATNIRRPPIFPMRKSEKKVFLAKLNIHLILRDVSKKISRNYTF